MGQDVWIREDGVEMLGQHSPRRPGAHICTCWFYSVKRDQWEAMCGAERNLNDPDPLQLLGLGYLPKPDDCEKCRVLFVKAMLDGNIYHHSIHEVAKHTLAKENRRQEKIKRLEDHIQRLKEGDSFAADLDLLLKKLPETTRST